MLSFFYLDFCEDDMSSYINVAEASNFITLSGPPPKQYQTTKVPPRVTSMPTESSLGLQTVSPVPRLNRPTVGMKSPRATSLEPLESSLDFQTICPPHNAGNGTPTVAMKRPRAISQEPLPAKRARPNLGECEHCKDLQAEVKELQEANALLTAQLNEY